MAEKSEKIEFPHEWEFRAFCVSDLADKVFAAVMELLEREPGGGEAEWGESSKSGAYRALRISTIVRSREHLQIVSGAISRIEGVKFML